MNQNPGDEDRGDEGSTADAPLHEALDNLENMFGPHGVPAPGSEDMSPGINPFTGADIGKASSPAARPESTMNAALPPDAPAGPAGAETWDPVPYRLTAQRLASEVEIIMNARLEAALARLGEEVRREVQNHIEIVLPEIVSSLAATDTTPRRD